MFRFRYWVRAISDVDTDLNSGLIENEHSFELNTISPIPISHFQDIPLMTFGTGIGSLKECEGEKGVLTLPLPPKLSFSKKVCGKRWEKKKFLTFAPVQG